MFSKEFCRSLSKVKSKKRMGTRGDVKSIGMFNQEGRPTFSHLREKEKDKAKLLAGQAF